MVTQDNLPSYFLKTPRTGFRRWTREDVALAKQLWGEDAVSKYICAEGRFTEQEIVKRLYTEIDNLIKFNMQYWPFFALETGELIGCCGVRPFQGEEQGYEIGFHLRKKFWGKGYASEAATAVIKEFFAMGKADRLYAGHHPDNSGSQKLLKRLGFEPIGERFYEPTGLFHPCYVLHRKTER